MANSFYTKDELEGLGLRFVGRDVKISRLSSIYQPGKLSIGDHSRIDDFCILSGDIVIEKYVHVAAFVALYGSFGIMLEDFSSLAARVSVYSASDDYVFGAGLTNPTVPEAYKKLSDMGPVRLKRHATVGCHSVIMPDCTIGEGASVGALSLVRGDLEEWGIYTGVPAEKRGSRRSQTIRRLEARLLAEEAKIEE